MHSPSSTAGPRASLRATALAALAVSTSLLLHALPVQAAEPAASAAARSYQIDLFAGCQGHGLLFSYFFQHQLLMQQRAGHCFRLSM